jgi:Protein of unknown function (DUF1573)
MHSLFLHAHTSYKRRMKRFHTGLLMLPLAMLLLFTACGEKPGKGKDKGQDPKTNAETFKLEPGQGTPIQFSYLTMQFGPVISGDTVHAVYPFKNMTNTAVTVTDALTSCPCMMTDFPKGPIQPGEIGEIKVNFATANQMGRHEKIIAVMLQGSNEPISLRLNGQIDPKQ